MKPTTRQRYAVAAMVDLAFQSRVGPAGLHEVAKRQGIPSSYLEPLLGKLRRAGLVRSWRGPGGGYSLGRDPGLISLADIFVAVDGRVAINESRREGPIENSVQGSTEELWAMLAEKLLSYLEEVSLETLMSTRSAADTAARNAKIARVTDSLQSAI